MVTEPGGRFNSLGKTVQNAHSMPRPDATDLSPESLLQAYANGAFPMADARTGEVRLYTCDPRCVIPLESFALPKSAVRALRGGDLVVKCDTAFEQVMRACAADRDGEDSTWISESMVQAYVRLHALGHAL
jgi:leucyl/phenylalanyl-tRNA--protein transferase